MVDPFDFYLSYLWGRRKRVLDFGGEMEGLLGEKKKVVVVGGGVAGSLIARNLQDHAYVVLIDP